MSTHYKLEVSEDGGTTWLDLTGETGKVEFGGSSRDNNEWFGLNADSPDVNVGARHAMELTLSAKYANDQTAAAQKLWEWHEAGTGLQVRVTPVDGSGYRWVSAAAYVTECTPPKHEGGSAEPLLMEAKFFGVFSREAVA